MAIKSMTKEEAFARREETGYPVWYSSPGVLADVDWYCGPSVRGLAVVWEKFLPGRPPLVRSGNVVPNAGEPCSTLAELREANEELKNLLNYKRQQIANRDEEIKNLQAELFKAKKETVVANSGVSVVISQEHELAPFSLVVEGLEIITINKPNIKQG